MKYLITNDEQLAELFLLSDKSLCRRISVIESINILSKNKLWGVDTETTGLCPHQKQLLTAQIGNSIDQFCIDCKTIDIKLYKDFFEDITYTFIFHNAKFDLKFLYAKYIIPKKIYDTFLVERLLFLGYPPNIAIFSLAKVCLKYCNITMNKDIRKTILEGKLTPAIIHYALKDVEYLIPIYDKQNNLLKQSYLEKAAEIENKFVRVLAYTEFCGIKLDSKKWLENAENNQEYLNPLLESLNDYVIENFHNSKFVNNFYQGDLFSNEEAKPECLINWNSSTQVIELFDIIGIKLDTTNKKTKEFTKSVQSNVLESQKAKFPLLIPYLDYKGLKKVISTYGENFISNINPITGRIHTQFNQLKNTGRLSSGGSKDKDDPTNSAPNLQNIPADDRFRSCFIADDNNILIDCDYTAQEDLVFTEKSQEIKLIEFYNDINKRDGHSFVAKMCFPEELKDIEEKDIKRLRPDLRQNAKGCKFCFHYGGQPKTAAKNLNISEKIAQDVYDAYFKAFPGIAAYFDKVKRTTWENGYILISEITGHKYYLYGWDKWKEFEKEMKSKDFWERYKIEKEKNTNSVFVNNVKEYFKFKSSAERNSLNYPIQGTAAVITKVAGILFFNYLEKNNLLFKVLIANIVHDEYLIESPIDISEKIAHILQLSMEKAGSMFCKSVTLKAIPKISPHWVH